MNVWSDTILKYVRFGNIYKINFVAQTFFLLVNVPYLFGKRVYSAVIIMLI
jgi:hypothetical protein